MPLASGAHPRKHDGYGSNRPVFASDDPRRNARWSRRRGAPARCAALARRPRNGGGGGACLVGPATGICLATLIKACRKDLLGARDEALLRVAYDTGCRRSELVAIDVSQIEGPDGKGARVLLIPRGKTDREGQGAHAYLSPATLRAVARWRRFGEITKGPLVRRVETHFDGASVRSGRALSMAERSR